jgi:sulfite reductase alpha subunit-like flavoprotein
MQNKYVTEEDIKQVFFQSKMDNFEGYDFDELLDFADKVIMFASFEIARVERDMCINFVKTLNAEVAQALKDKRGNL